MNPLESKFMEYKADNLKKHREEYMEYRGPNAYEQEDFFSEKKKQER